MGVSPVPVEVSLRIAAAPEVLYDLVADVRRMGQWSPETTSCRWLGRGAGAAVGRRFLGTNRAGWRRWATLNKVVQADRGRCFAFETEATPGIPVARWTYEFVADGQGGTTVTERWTDRRSMAIVRLGTLLSGVSDRAGHNGDGMRATLERLRAHAEAGGT